MKRQPRDPPCKRHGIPCEERHQTCHDTCEKYLEWRQYHRDARRALADDQALRKAAEELHAAGIRRSKRGTTRRKDG